jgi:hypothetical protein
VVGSAWRTVARCIRLAHSRTQAFAATTSAISAILPPLYVRPASPPHSLRAVRSDSTYVRMCACLRTLFACVDHDASSGFFETSDNVIEGLGLSGDAAWVLLHGYVYGRGGLYYQPPLRVSGNYVDSGSFYSARGSGSGASNATGSACIDCTHWGNAYGNQNCTVINTTVVREGAAWPERAREVMRLAGPRVLPPLAG